MGACLAALLAAGVSAQQQSQLQILPAGRGITAYELAQGGCHGGDCPFEVRLLRAGVPVGDPVALAWSPSQAGAHRVEADPAHGAGTPLSPVAAGQPVWFAGEEEAFVSASARTLPLPGAADGEQALLISQMAGFEHPKRRHALYVATAKGLRLAWSYDEPPGPVVSWVLAPAGQGPVLVVRQGALREDGPDLIEVHSLQWHAGGASFIARLAKPPAALQAVVAGRHASVAAAQAARLRQGPCLAGYAVVQTRPAGRAPRYALMQVAADATEARAETQRLLGCGGRLRPRTVPLARLLPFPVPVPVPAR